MTPWVFHALCMAAVLLLGRHSRKTVLAAATGLQNAPQIFEYGPAYRWFCIIGTGLMAVLLLIAERMQEAQNPDDESIIPFIIALAFNFNLLVVLDRRIVIDDDGASSGMSLLHPRRVPKAAFRGAKVTSTAFFGGVTTFHTQEGRVRVWHQLENHASILRQLRALV